MNPEEEEKKLAFAADNPPIDLEEEKEARGNSTGRARIEEAKQRAENLRVEPQGGNQVHSQPRPRKSKFRPESLTSSEEIGPLDRFREAQVSLSGQSTDAHQDNEFTGQA